MSTNEQRSLREHLADPQLYAGVGPAAPARSAAWRAALLARYPARAGTLRPVSEASALRRLLLLIALPLAAALAIVLLALAGFDFALHWSLPRAPSAETLTGLLVGHAPSRPPGLYVWFGLAGLSTLLTFLVRGRVPRLLPLDW